MSFLWETWLPPERISTRIFGNWGTNALTWSPFPLLAPLDESRMIEVVACFHWKCVVFPLLPETPATEQVPFIVNLVLQHESLKVPITSC